jgi:glycosyltransferase involved in cell wall biosynthesis
MRTLDGVTFISEFGRDSALAECPDLALDRMHVVSCGADPSPLPGEPDSTWGFGLGTPFMVCLSSTFWHKNRAHAIATFDQLVREHAYTGHLVIGGPEPFYGRSTADEDELIERLPIEARSRVHRIGHVSEANKWWLLRNAALALYPSVVEGFGLIPFEAAAVATPCLTFQGTAPGELLAGTTATIDTWVPAAWAEAAQRLLTDHEAAALNIAGIDRVASSTTWKACAERTWGAIDHALASPRRLRDENDGGWLERITPDRHRSSRAASLRFDLVRVGPALGRRLRPSSRLQGEPHA